MTEETTIARRRSPNFWEPYSWAVRVLVSRGFGTTEACRRIMARGGIEPTRENLACLRVRYYQIRDREWPATLSDIQAEPPRKNQTAETPEAAYGEPEPEPEVMESPADIDDFEV